MDIFGKKPNVEKIRVNKDVEGLIRTLKYEDKDVRWETAVALGNIRDGRAVEPLLRVLDDTHNNAAATALEKIGFNFSDSPHLGLI